MFENLPTPRLLLDLERMEANIRRMQSLCDARSVELRPHIKTHKMVEVARRQLQAGAAGLTCAKLGEAEAMVPAFAGLGRPGSIFVAHSLVDTAQAARLRRLAESIDELILACTSEAHAPVLEALLAKAGLTLPVMMAVDLGLNREGARGLDGAVRLARLITEQPHLQLHGIYAHEGHFYTVSPEQRAAELATMHGRLLEIQAAVQEAIGVKLRLWPGCSVTADLLATQPGLDAVRPGAYVFGDLHLSEFTGVMKLEDVALSVLTTVVDRPTSELALLDAGTKTFSSDKDPDGCFARSMDDRRLNITRLSEEHGFVTGDGVDALRIGERIRCIPAHVCPVVNLADEVTVIKQGEVLAQWKVDARGKNQ